MADTKQGVNAESATSNVQKSAETLSDETTSLSAEIVDTSSFEADYYLSGLFNIETSPGFRALDLLKREISEEKISKLKTEFTKIHSFLLYINACEKGTGEHLRNTTQELTVQRLEQDRAISQQFSGNAEIGELKRELLKCQNEVDTAIERESKLQSDIDDLQKSKQDLVHDIEEIRRHKADMLEPQLIASTKELKMELIQRRNQVDTLQKDMEEKQAVLDNVMAERDRNEAEREKHSLTFVKASETPLKIIKQVEVLKDAIVSLGSENVKQAQICLSLDREIERLTKKKKDLEEQRIGQSAAYEERRGLINQMERQVDDIFKDHELAKEQLSFQKAERVRLELAHKRTIQDIKREHDYVLRVIREKDSYLKLYRRLELTVNNIKMSTPTIIKQGDELQRQLKTIKNDEIFYRKQLTQLRQNLDVSTLEFLKQDRIEKTELEEWEKQIATNKELEENLEHIVSIVKESSKNVDALTMERDLKSREVVRARGKLRMIKNDVATKEIAILDGSKRAQETQNRVKEFMALYDLVKNERNKYLNQIHSTSQRSSEMKEKIKILSNEIEILRHELSNKDRELAKKKQDSGAAYSLRDTLKNEANKLLVQYRDKRDQIDHRLARIEALNATINQAESDMIQVKAKYELSIKDRNVAGIQLLDRNDELCILYERINVQKEITDKGKSSLREREEEQRKLDLIMAELKRQLERSKRKQPFLKEYEDQIEKFESERLKLNAIVVQLGQEMENPDEPKRSRNLEGEDPTPESLSKKIEKMELLLSTQEEKILEKDLVLDEVASLTERLQQQTNETKDETHHTTKEINELTKKIKNLTRKTMAKVSELAMHQASAMSLYREKVEKESLLEEGKNRLASGDIPLEQIEGDFIRTERLRAQRRAHKEALQQLKDKEQSGRFIELEDEFYLHGNVKTTAEPRPNAYIPQINGMGQLPIPKPYGEHSPFKPQEPGAQLRHYKKPVIKPIEI